MSRASLRDAEPQAHPLQTGGPTIRLKRSIILPKGFALVDLLVSLTIIALLAAVVLAAVHEARIRAKVARKNEIAHQYLNALELFASDHGGSYPDRPGVFCLGMRSNEECGPGVPGNDELLADLTPYFPAVPAETDLVVNGFSGILYIQTGQERQLKWFLPGLRSCPLGALKTTSSSATTCTHYLET